MLKILEGIKAAVRAGVRSIEHGSFIDDEGIALMKERGTYLVPTLLIGKVFEQRDKAEGALEKMITLTKKYSIYSTLFILVQG